MDEGIAALEMNSSINQRHVKKSHTNCPVLSVESLKYAGIKMQALRVNSFTDISKCFLIKCRTTFLEKKYE